MDFAPSFFEHLSDRLELALYDINAEYRMRAFMDANLPPISFNRHQPEKPTMSNITGIKPGDVKGILQKVRDEQSQALAKVTEVATKSSQVAEAMNGVTGSALKELDATLAELGQFSNLGPTLDGQA